MSKISISGQIFSEILAQLCPDISPPAPPPKKKKKTGRVCMELSKEVLLRFTRPWLNLYTIAFVGFLTLRSIITFMASTPVGVHVPWFMG